jgi:glutamate dehydrogenase
VPDVAFDELERTVIEMSRSWGDRVGEALAGMTDNASELVALWSPRLPDYYQTSTSLAVAAKDILELESLASSGERLAVGIQNETDGKERLTRIAVYSHGEKLELSDILPPLEALGLRVVEEVPPRWETMRDVHPDIGVIGPDGGQLDIDRVGGGLDAIEAALRGGHQRFIDRLVVLTRLNHHEVRIPRACRSYRRRVSSFAGICQRRLAAHPHRRTNRLVVREAVRPGGGCG